jgi:hypothetical protein
MITEGPWSPPIASIEILITRAFSGRNSRTEFAARASASAHRRVETTIVPARSSNRTRD